MTRLIFIDVEASTPTPMTGVMTEIGAVDYTTRKTFYGQLWEFNPHPDIPALPVPTIELGEQIVMESFNSWLKGWNERVVMVSDNPAYDFMWVASYFDKFGIKNPLGFSARRIGDYWAGLRGSWGDSSGWKKYRKTTHDHNPVNDAMGNVEAFEAISKKYGVKL